MVVGYPYTSDRRSAQASGYVVVNILSKIEKSFERLMEGTTGSLFNQALQPAEIGKHLERAMLARQKASFGSAIVPNVFDVGLHPRDFAEFADFTGGLARQLEAWLAQVATRQNLSFVDRVRVEVHEDANARRRQPKIVATFADDKRAQPARPTPSPAPAQATSVYRVDSSSRGVTASLRAIDGPERGRTYIVPRGETSVGRSPENDIVLDQMDVSRRHARLTCTNLGLRVEDLHSTNGTRVNGSPVRLADLENGDELTVGGVHLQVTVHRDGGTH